jgi:hypothetical protein
MIKMVTIQVLPEEWARNQFILHKDLIFNNDGLAYSPRQSYGAIRNGGFS